MAVRAGATPGNAAVQRRWRMSERTGFLALLGLMILPLWLFTYFPSTDGPVHLNIATIIRDYDDPASTRLRAFFQFNENIEPNIVAHHLIAWLSRVTGILTAEKIFLSLWVLLFCLAGRAMVLAVNPSGGAVSYLLLPTVFSYFAHDGYYNFILGMALCFLGIGLWYTRRARLTAGWLAILAFVGIVTVCTHLFSFLMLIFVIGVVTTFDYARKAWEARKTGELHDVALAYVGRASILVLTFLPGIWIVASFVLRHGVTDAVAHEQDKLNLLKHLLTLSYLYSFDPIEILFFGPLVALLAGLAVRLLIQRARQSRLMPADAFLLVLVCLVGVYFFVPLTTKEVAISQRFLGYITAILIVWLASIELPRRWRTGLAAGVAALVLAITAYRGWKYELYNGLIDVYVSASDHVEPHSTVLALHYWKQREPLAGRQITWRTDPFRHAASYIAMRTGGIDLRSSMMAQSVYGYFPVIYRPALDPYAVMGDVESNPPEIDLLGFEERTGERVDYVLIWDYDGTTPEDSLHRQLAQAYVPAYAAADGLVRLYRKRDGGP